MRWKIVILGFAAMIAAVCPVHAQDSNPPPLRGFGVCTHLSRRASGWRIEHLLPLMQQMGVSVIRDEIDWGSVERKRGEYAIPPEKQAWFDAVSKAGIQTIVVLDYGNNRYDNPLDPDAFANYAAWMAKHFKDDAHIMAFEIWNEPNNFEFLRKYGGMWNGKNDAPWIEKFAELVEKASAAIRREDPQRVIITGYGVPPASVYGMMRFPQTWKNIDGLTDHPYTFTLPPELAPWGGAKTLDRDGIALADDDHSMVSLFRRQQEASAKELGRTLPLWVTEFGYTTFHKVNNNKAMYAGFSEQAQAAYHTRALIQAMAYGVKAWCIYDLMDDGTSPTNAEFHFGLIRNEKYGYAPKPAFFAIRRIAQLLGSDWQYLSAPPAEFDLNQSVTLPSSTLMHDQQPIDIDGKPCVYWFRTPTHVVAIIWMSGRYQVEFSPGMGRLTWPDLSTKTPVEAVNLITGQIIPVEAVKAGNGLSLQNIPVGSEPIVISYPYKP